MPSLFISLLAMLLMPFNVMAEPEPEMAATIKAAEASTNNWELIKEETESGTLCYLKGRPEKSSGDYKYRGEVYFIVSYKGGGDAEISSSSGFNYKKAGKPDVTFDNGEKFNLYTSSETPKVAWAKDKNSDRLIVREMLKSSGMVIKSVSNADVITEDSYNLQGFGDSYSSMIGTCK